jgi:hypothetical protein
MNRNFLVAIRVTAENGLLVDGNMAFNTDEPLTVKLLDKVKVNYCAMVNEEMGLGKKGVYCDPVRAVIYAVISLEA